MQKTEKKLKKAFDYQRFEKNADLEKLIEQTEDRYRCAKELSDEDLDHVAAAGDAAQTALEEGQRGSDGSPGSAVK